MEAIMSIGGNEAVEEMEENPNNWHTVKCQYCGEFYRRNKLLDKYDEYICPSCREKMNKD